MSFDSFSFEQRIQAGISAAGYTTPTPIQTRAIPAVLSGKDVMGLAQTGTGKTAAFVLPLLQRLLTADAARRGPIRVLVLAPTRELAVQIHQTFVDLGKQTGFRSTVIIGGVGQTPQVNAARQSTVLVACPGRLLDLINQRLVDLSAVSALILDEADRMFDMGFLPDVKRIMAQLPSRRQTLLFSATMPAEVRALAESVLHDPVVVQVSNTAPAATISHAIYPVAASRKQDLLERLLAENGQGSALVFTRTKHRAKGLAKKLAGKGFAATALQGNLSQNRRQEAMGGFKSGTYRVMVATDIAARGIDCERVSLVVNFDLPDTAEAYTHRIGRTGRAERSGQAVSLVAPEDESQARFIERALNKRIERRHVDGFADAQAGGTHDAAQARSSMERPSQNRSGQNRPGQSRSGRNHSAQESSPQGRISQDRSNKSRSAQNQSAKGRSNQDPRGQNRTAQGSSEQSFSGKALSSQDFSHDRTSQDRTPMAAPRGDLKAAATKSLLPRRRSLQSEVQTLSDAKSSPAKSMSGKPASGAAKSGEAKPKAASPAKQHRQDAGSDMRAKSLDEKPKSRNNGRARRDNLAVEDRWSQAWFKVLPPLPGDAGPDRRAQRSHGMKSGKPPRRES